MYYQHWGISQSPFDTSPVESRYQSNMAHEESLARARFLIDNHRSVGLLLGAAGSGKTLLLTVLAAELAEADCRVARFSLTGLDVDEFLGELALQWGCRPQAGQSRGQLWRSLIDTMAEHHYEEMSSIVLLDDVDTASPSVLEGVSRLVQADPTGRAKLTVLLACRQDRSSHLGESLLERCDLRIDLSPWERDETAEFLVESLSRVGRKSPLFTEEAVSRLHALSHGVPRRVSQLADLALVAGAGGEMSNIDAATIDTVYRELSVLSIG